MIISFVHKGLERFFKTGDTRGIQAKHAKRLNDMLAVLDDVEAVEDVDLPGYNLHLLHPKSEKVYAAKVSGNWRLTFRFVDGNAEIVNYLDYH